MQLKDFSLEKPDFLIISWYFQCRKLHLKEFKNLNLNVNHQSYFTLPIAKFSLYVSYFFNIKYMKLYTYNNPVTFTKVKFVKISADGKNVGY